MLNCGYRGHSRKMPATHFGRGFIEIAVRYVVAINGTLDLMEFAMRGMTRGRACLLGLAMGDGSQLGARGEIA